MKNKALDKATSNQTSFMTCIHKYMVSMKKIGKYLREISVVVIGVAITLWGSNRISNRHETRDLALYLKAVTTELEENAENFDMHAQKFQKSVRYAEYVQSHDEKSISADSISYYAGNGDGWGWSLTMSFVFYSKNAFEMFKMSGSMRLVTDKELLIYLMRTYDLMEEKQHDLDMLFDEKREEDKRDWYLEEEGKDVVIPMKRFYSGYKPYTMMHSCESISKRIKETLLKLEEAKIGKR